MPQFTGRLRTPRLSAAPSSPVSGEMYYDTATNKLYWWNGTTWVDSTGGTDLVYNGAFPTNTPYTDGDIVIYNNTAWMCVKPTSNAPTAWPTVPAGSDLTYEGDYTGASYQDGDIVVSNGIAYLCVTPTSALPTPWPGGPGAPAPAPTVNYGTTLPASPVNGQEAILVDNATNPTYQWRFRFNANSTSAYKWEFVGGTPALLNYQPGTPVVLNALTVVIGSMYYPNVAGGFLAAPRAGEYMVAGTALFDPAGVATYVYITPFFDTTQPGGGTPRGQSVQTSTSFYLSATFTEMFGTVAAGLKIGVAVTSGNVSNTRLAVLQGAIRPVRVS